MIRYKKYQVTGENSPLKGFWYARPVIEETFDIEKLAKHMSNHNTPYSSGVIKGVLTDMVSCTKELILDGKNVKMDDLAIFSVGIVSKKGAKSAADFSLANNVKGLSLPCTPWEAARPTILPVAVPEETAVVSTKIRWDNS